MTSSDGQQAAESTTHVADSGLECPHCDYNLTGITSERCPECGSALDYALIHRERDAEASRPGTHWERYGRNLKPLGFSLTAFRVALLPWLFARELHGRPSLPQALGFLLVCVVGGIIVAVLVGDAGTEDVAMWLIGVACQILLQTLLFGFALRPRRSAHPFRFWLAVSSYTSYPLLLEGFARPPYILGGESNIWPFSIWGGTSELLTSILYHLWWVGLAVIAAVRLPRRWRKRVLLLVVAIPVLTYMSSYTGCYLGGHLA